MVEDSDREWEDAVQFHVSGVVSDISRHSLVAMETRQEE